MEIRNVTTVWPARLGGGQIDVSYYQRPFYFHQFQQNLIIFCFTNKTGENYLKRQNCQPLPHHLRCDQYHHTTDHTAPHHTTPHHNHIIVNTEAMTSRWQPVASWWVGGPRSKRKEERSQGTNHNVVSTHYSVYNIISDDKMSTDKQSRL